MTAAPRSASIFLLRALFRGPSLRSSILVRLLKHEQGPPERRAPWTTKVEKRGKGRGGLELGGYLLEDLVKVHPHSRVSGLWIRRPVTPALSDQPHCFNLPPKRSFPLFSSLLFLLLFFFFPLSFSIPLLHKAEEHTDHASFVLPSFVVVLLVPFDGLFPTRLPTHDPRTVLLWSWSYGATARERLLFGYGRRYDLRCAGFWPGT